MRSRTLLFVAAAAALVTHPLAAQRDCDCDDDYDYRDYGLPRSYLGGELTFARPAGEFGEEFRLGLGAVVEGLLAEEVGLEGGVELLLLEPAAPRRLQDVESLEAVPRVAEVFRQPHVRLRLHVAHRVVFAQAFERRRLFRRARLRRLRGAGGGEGERAAVQRERLEGGARDGRHRVTP